MRRMVGILVVSLVSMALLLSLLFVVVHPLDRARAAYTSHPPILIEGNYQFLPENGVTGGSGTEGDPYVIEDWDVACGVNDGIAIVDTTAHFVIRNVYVHDSTTHMPPVAGIFLGNVTNGSVTHSTIANISATALAVAFANMTAFDNNTITTSHTGVWFYYSSYDMFRDNTVRNCSNGVYFWYSENNTAERNSVENSTSDGIRLENSVNNHVVENTALRNLYGIRLNDSYSNEIRANEVHDGYDQGHTAPIQLEHSENNTVSANDVSGYQWGIWLEYSESNVISGNTISGVTGSGGVQLQYSHRNTVTLCNITDCWTGVALYISGNNEIASNRISIPGYGIRALWSPNNNLTGNKITQALYMGIVVERSGSSNGSSNVTFNEVMSGKADGIRVVNSNQVNLSGNVISGNLRKGLAIYLSEGLTIMANKFTDDGIYIEDTGPTSPALIAVYNSHTITSDNTVDSKPILYYKNESGLDIDGIEVGQLILANCSHVNASDLEIAAADAGLIVGHSDWVNISGSEFSFNEEYGVMARATQNLTIFKCTAFKNRAAMDLLRCQDVNVSGSNIVGNTFGGLNLFRCNRCIVLSNRVVNNTEWGIGLGETNDSLVWGNKIAGSLVGFWLVDCRNATIYHNDFSNPTQVSEYMPGDVPLYNYTYPIGGNYWSDYVGSDVMSGPAQDVSGADGIGDTPYEVSPANKDFYPLMLQTWAPNSPPNAVLGVLPLAGDLDTTFVFDASGSNDAEDPNKVLTYRWDWEDDGTWDTAYCPDGIADHKFAAPGTYTVRVEVMDMEGGLDSTTVTVIVSPVIPEFDGLVVPILGILMVVFVLNFRRLGKSRA